MCTAILPINLRGAVSVISRRARKQLHFLGISDDFQNGGDIMEQLYVFGTGNAQAIHCYNTCFALRTGTRYFMVDAGGATES